MKILLLSYKFHPDIGGIETISDLLATNFVDFGNDVKVVTTSVSNNHENFKYEVVRNPNWLDLIKLHNWADVILENNTSLHLSWPSFFFRKAHVIAIHTWITRIDGTLALRDKIKLLWLNRATAVIAISEKVRELTFAKAIVIGNPYNSKLFKQNGLIKNKDFVFIGRLVSDKGCDMCIELLNELNNHYGKQFSLTIIGDGPEMKKLKELTRLYNLTNQIRFLGFLTGDAIVYELNAHRYLLVPSRWEEPFGIVALEGMASGCIPIVSDGGGLPDAVGNAGVIFKRNSMQDLIDKTKNLIVDKNQQMNLQDKINAHLAKHTETVVSQLYFDVLLKASKS